MRPGITAVLFDPAVAPPHAAVAGWDAFAAWLSARDVAWSIAQNGDYGRAAAMLRTDIAQCVAFVSSRQAMLSARAAGAYVIRVLDGAPTLDDDVDEIDTFAQMLRNA